MPTCIKQTLYCILFISYNILCSQSIVYNFEALTTGLIAGQDNWMYMGNMNTNGSVTSYCIIPSLPAPPLVATTSNQGSYIGGKGLSEPGTNGGTHCFISRKNDAAWSFTAATQGAGQYLIMEMDYGGNNWWGTSFQLGYDANNDGDYSSTCSTADANELSFGFGFAQNNVFVYNASGIATATCTPCKSALSLAVPPHWVKLRLTIDLVANTGCLSWMNHTTGVWTTFSGLNAVPMGITSSGTTQANRNNLNGMIFQQEAGGVGLADNFGFLNFNAASNPCSTVILPIELIDFTANCTDDKVDIKWVTASELNNSYFELEKSFDGIHFNSIAQIKGNGTQTQMQKYHYEDFSLSVQNNFYYRLKQVDFNGAVRYSKIITVSNTCKGFDSQYQLLVYPNPSNGLFTILSNQNEDGLIEIYSLQGVLVHQSEWKGTQHNINLTNLAKGTYLLKIQSIKGDVYKKILVQ